MYGTLKRHDNIKCKNPYGICLSEDGSKLYITDTGNSRIGVYNTLNWDYSWLDVENKSAIALCVDGYGNLYFSETRKLYRFSLKTQRCELVINSEIWKSLYGTRLCHLGAVASISEDKLAISDTVKNNVYILNIESVED